MSDGIAKGIGEQLGGLGKQIVQEVTQLPVKLTGMDVKAPDEKMGDGTGAKKQQSVQQKSGQTKLQGETFNPLELLKQKEEAEKKQKLAEARRLLQQFIEPPSREEPGIKEKLELEEMEQKKKEIEEEKKKAKQTLQQPSSKVKRGNLYGIKSKQFGGETGKNVKSQ